MPTSPAAKAAALSRTVAGADQEDGDEVDARRERPVVDAADLAAPSGLIVLVLAVLAGGRLRGVRLDAAAVLRRRGRRPGRDLPRACRRTSARGSCPTSYRDQDVRWRTCPTYFREQVQRATIEPDLGGRRRRAGRPTCARRARLPDPKASGRPCASALTVPSLTSPSSRPPPRSSQPTTPSRPTTPAPAKRPRATPTSCPPSPRSGPAPAATSSCCCCCSPSASCCVAYLNVGLAMNGAFPPDMLSYGAGLLGIAGAFHLVLRWRASYADPLLLPIATLLNGLGLVMIHRLDLAYNRTGMDALALNAAGLERAERGHRAPRVIMRCATTGGCGATPTPPWRPAWRCCCCRWSPAWAAACNGSRIWIGLGPFTFQPGEVAKILLAIFFAGYLVQTRDVLALVGRRFARHRAAARPATSARSSSPGWPASVSSSSRSDLGSSLLFFGLFVAMLYVATERRSWIAIGMVLFCGGAYLAYLLFGHVQQRVLLWLHPFSERALETSDQLVQGLFGMASGGLFGTGLGRGRPELTYFAGERLHRPQLRRGARPGRRLRPAAALRADRRARPAHRPRRPRRLRQAARRRPVLLDGPAVLRRRRRRHPRHPADRPDHAVPVLRRVLPAGQLVAGRAAAADQRPGPPPACPTSRRPTSAPRPPRTPRS